MRPSDRRAGLRTGWRTGLLAVLLVLVAAVLYRPWRSLPLDIWDFREFVPLLRGAAGPWDQWVALVEYYATHGRANVLFYGSFVAQWQLFGLEPAGWQWWRFASMVGVLLLSMVLLRRLGSSPWGAAAGTALLVAATSAQRAWVQLMAEPQAMILLLLAALVATGYQAAERWVGRAVGICLLLLGVLLTKEVVGVLGGAVIGLALCRGSTGGWHRPRWARRDLALVALGCGVALAVAALLVLVRTLPGAEGYGMGYGQGALALPRLAGNFGRAFLPHSPQDDLRLGLVYPANLLFLLVLGIGLRQRLQHAGGKRTAVLVGATAMLALPLAGALAYWPWTKWDSFYGLPFHYGAVLLLAVAVTDLEAAPPVRRAVIRVAAIAILAYLAVGAQQLLGISDAILRLNARLAREYVALGPSATVAVLEPADPARQLPVGGIELKEYAIAMDWASREDLPTVLEGSCETAGPLLEGRGGSLTLVSFSYGCGRLPGAPASLSEEFAYRDWLSLGRRTGMLVADLVPVRAPPPAPPGPTTPGPG